MLLAPRMLLVTVLMSPMAMASDAVVDVIDASSTAAVASSPDARAVASPEGTSRSEAMHRSETVLPATVSSVPPDLAIFGGVQKSEVSSSVTSVLEVARRCVAHGVLVYRARPQPTRTPYVGVRQIGERRVRLERRSANYSCQAQPVTHCSFVYVWDDDVPEIGYASVQCRGSYDSRKDMYLVTAQRDLGSWRVRSIDRSDRAASLSFQTTEFPGTHMIAYGSMRRDDGKVTRPVQMAIFDDFKSFDSRATVSVETREVDALAQGVLELACKSVGTCAEE